jgi:integral membrane sensor domain MASE1
MYLAFALLHGRSRARLPAGFPAGVARWLSSAGGYLALLALALGVAAWTTRHDLTTALLLSVVSSCVVASAFTLLAPVWPELSFGLAFVCLPVALWGAGWSLFRG